MIAHYLKKEIHNLHAVYPERSEGLRFIMIFPFILTDYQAFKF